MANHLARQMANIFFSPLRFTLSCNRSLHCSKKVDEDIYPLIGIPNQPPNRSIAPPILIDQSKAGRTIFILISFKIEYLRIVDFLKILGKFFTILIYKKIIKMGIVGGLMVDLIA